MKNKSNHILNSDKGVVLITTLIFLMALTALAVSYYRITNYHVDIGKSSKKTSYGYYAAEAGLNRRIQALRSTFISYSTPTGTSPTLPTDVSGDAACEGDNDGTGELGCQTLTIGDHTVYTYVEELNNGESVKNIIEPGDDYAGLQALDFQYILHSKSINPTNNKTEAVLGMQITSRVIPMLQFAAFYDQDLEVLSEPTSFQLLGPIHSNNNIYFYGSTGGIKVSGPITSVGTLLKGWKGTSNTGLSLQVDQFGGNDDTYNWRTVSLSGSHASGYSSITTSEVTNYNNNIRIGVDPADATEYASIARNSNSDYWDRANLRVVLKLNASNAPDTSCVTGNNGIEIQNSDGSCNIPLTQKVVTNCTTMINTNLALNNGITLRNHFPQFVVNGTTYSPSGSGASSVKTSVATNTYSTNVFGSTSADHAYGRCVQLMDINVSQLMRCIEEQELIPSGINKTDGFTLFFSVEGKDAATVPATSPRFNEENPSTPYYSKYAIRLHSGSNLKTPYSGAPSVERVAFVTDLPMYVKGHFNIGTSLSSMTFNQLRDNPENAVNKIPAILVGDRLYVQSSNWSSNLEDDISCGQFVSAGGLQDVDNRVATDTAIFSGFFFKIPVSCGSMTSYNCGLGGSNYGLGNYAQLQEDWDGQDLVMHGSFINLTKSLHSTSTSDANYSFGGNQIKDYIPAERYFSFDTDFMDLDGLPPTSPSFVKIKQKFFVQYFEEEDF